MRKQPFQNNDRYDGANTKGLYSFSSNISSRNNKSQTSQARNNTNSNNTSRNIYNGVPEVRVKQSVQNIRQKNQSSLQKFRRESRQQQKPKQPVIPKRRFYQKIGNYQRAPSNQFKIYLDDSENVFWQNSWQVRRVNFCKKIRAILIYFFLILLVTYIGIGGIQPWPQSQCPEHAQCGVFIHCKKGYIREDNKCFLDPAIKVRAKSIVIASVDQLKLEYGALDCETEFKKIPSKGTLQIFQQFKVEDQQLKNQIYNLLEDKQVNVKYNFNYQQFIVTPTEKNHPLACQIQLFTQTSDFYWLLLFIFIGLFCITKLILYSQFKRKAKAAYEYLRTKCEQNDSVLIEQYKRAIRDFAGEWNENLWQQIDRLRYQERLIVYYEQDEQLYWKMFKWQQKQKF